MMRAKRRGRGTLPATEASSTGEKRKRLYQTVTVVDAAGAYGVALDGRLLHTPGRTVLATSCKQLADAVAEEWDSQKEAINPASMPLSRLLNTAIDRVTPRRDEIISELLRYVDTDLLCYRAETPDSLIERQEKIWQPVLNWLAAVHNVTLIVRSGLMPVSQPDDSAARVHDVLTNHDDLTLTAIQATAVLTGSLALALALAGKHLTHREVFAAAQLDETWQMERWGEDTEALDRRQAMESDLRSIERFLSLIQ